MTTKSRRHFLRSSSTVIALPLLESLGFSRVASAAPVTAPPKRMMSLGTGFGVTAHAWFPELDDTGYDDKLLDAYGWIVNHLESRFAGTA